MLFKSNYKNIDNLLLLSFTAHTMEHPITPLLVKTRSCPLIFSHDAPLVGLELFLLELYTFSPLIFTFIHFSLA